MVSKMSIIPLVCNFSGDMLFPIFHSTQYMDKGHEQVHAKMTKWILGSASPRRIELLRLTGQAFTVMTADIEEPVFHPGDPVASSLALAENKHQALLPQCRNMQRDSSPADPASTFLITADTMVFAENEILNKPADESDAEKMLQTLSGRMHVVVTAVVLSKSNSKGTILKKESFFEQTNVYFHDLSKEEIQAYVASGSPMDKAGAYGIQDDRGAFFVRRIEGDYYNVVGFPLQAFYQVLKHSFIEEYNQCFSM